MGPMGIRRMRSSATKQWYFRCEVEVTWERCRSSIDQFHTVAQINAEQGEVTHNDGALRRDNRRVLRQTW